MPVRLLIPRRFYIEMVAQARAELPNECCGLLAGRMVANAGQPSKAAEWRVFRRYPLINKAASPVEYFADEQSLFHAFRDMHQEDLDLLAVYHSHPTTSPVPSQKDRERNYLGEVVHLIISLKGEVPEVGGWWLTEKDSFEAHWECTEDEADPNRRPP